MPLALSTWLKRCLLVLAACAVVGGTSASAHAQNDRHFMNWYERHSHVHQPLLHAGGYARPLWPRPAVRHMVCHEPAVLTRHAGSALAGGISVGPRPALRSRPLIHRQARCAKGTGRRPFRI